MTAIKQYEQLLERLAQGELPVIEKKIMGALKRNPTGMTRRALVMTVFGHAAAKKLSLASKDRAVRKGIESLRSKTVPIVSTSGRAGYKLDPTKEGIRIMIAEFESRIHKEQARVKDFRRMYRIPEPKQIQMDGVTG